MNNIMNREVLQQIVNECKAMPNESLRFNTWYCDEDGVVTMCPVGWHISNHPELKEVLNVRLDTMSHKGGTKKCWRVSVFDLAKYLDISYESTEVLFVTDWQTRKEFVETIESFVNGEIDIRKCQHSECNDTYITSPDNKACVCEYCEEILLEMCGL